MNLTKFKKKWEKIAESEVKIWDDTEEHDTDFTISYKDEAYSNYQTLLRDLKGLK